jgi:pSer/pThr/pTyr-binding forkhead associated (FHA) protein
MAIKFVIKQNGSNALAQDNPAIAEYVFDENLFTIGSDASNNLVVAETASEQAVVVREDEFLTLINRAEGTALNGKPLRREAFQPLEHGDRIEIGGYIVFVLDTEVSEDFQPEIISTNGALQIPMPEEALIIPEMISENKHVTAPDRKTEKASTSSRNFAAILDTLRTEEDSFYFVVENKAKKEKRRIRLEKSETSLGANKNSAIISNSEEITTVFAAARKDWSGILLEAAKPNTVFVNGEVLSAARRLRNEDRVSFSAPVKETLVLHEPSSLVALESIQATREQSEARFGIHKTSGAETENINIKTKTENKISLFERTFFGYFSLLEVVTMIFATLIGAVLVFLILEFAFS